MSTKRTFLRKMLSMCYLSAGGAAAYAGLSVYRTNEAFYRDVFMPLAMRLDPELAHDLAVAALKFELLPRSGPADPPVLKTAFLGKELDNPLGVAAGFDKHGEAVEGLRRLGFGCVEVGSVTPRAQPGNARPRAFRLPRDRAVINRYGFNSDGHEAVARRIEAVERTSGGALGVNLGKNKESEDAVRDYVAGVRAFGDRADYLVINVSSPNTPGLRSLQTKDNLHKLLSEVIATRDSLPFENKPFILLKLSPDLSPQERSDVVKVLAKKECKVDGLIISNTTLSREGLQDISVASEEGGLSGEPLKNKSTELIREMYEKTKGQIPIVGVGGVSSGADAFEKILAGATVVQIYTSFIYEGPPIVGRIKSELSQLLLKHGFENVNQAVGKESKIDAKRGRGWFGF